MQGKNIITLSISTIISRKKKWSLRYRILLLVFTFEEGFLMEYNFNFNSWVNVVG